MKKSVQTSVKSLAAALLTLIVAPPLTAEQTPPNPLGQPLLDANGHPREDAYIHIPLRPEDARYGVLDGMRMKAWLMEVDAISLADRDRGNLFWGRNVGTWGHVATQDWVERYFRQYGLQDIRRQSFDLAPQWQASSYDISFSAGGQTFALESARPPEDAESTPPAGVEYELVWVGQGSDADYLGRDVRGKAVVVQDIPLPGDIRHTLALEGVLDRAAAKGAAAVGIIYGISDNFAAWQPTGDLPGFNLGYEDGMRIRERLGRGERVTVRIRLQAEQVAGLTAASVWGTLPGASDEEVLVIAHMDGFFQAASDNGSGLAVMIGLLDYYSRIPQAERPRTIKFLGSVGHHGGPGTNWLAENAATALANTVFAINLEHVAVTRAKYWGPQLRMMNAVSPMRWWLYGSPAALDIVTDAFNRFNVGVTADMDPGASGEMGRMARLVPSMQVITSPEIKHTEQDTPEWVPAVGLEQIARAYAKIIDGLGALERSEIAPRLVP
ncbi:MAG: M28 family peptidase [Longimicrobiales bacterium]